jgi:nitrogen fixation/metabolism regulation signal transduction histidine kinase
MEIAVRVLDDGPGPDPGLGGRAFEAFVTGRASGTGLGLSLVRRVAEEHNGSAYLIRRGDTGAECGMRIPRKPQQPDGDGET